MNRTNELIKNTFIITIGKFATQILSFLLLPLYTGRLSSDEYGNYDFVIAVATFAIPIITLLLEESLFRFLIDAKNKHDETKIISNVVGFCLSSSIIICSITTILCVILKYKLGIYISIFVFSSVLMALGNSIVRGKGKISLFSLANFLLSLITILLNIILILVFNLGIEALIYSSVISNIFVSIFLFYKIKIFEYLKIDYFDKELIKSMLKYSLPLVPNTICWAVINLSDRLIIMFNLGASLNGIYSIANKFPNLINTFYSFFNIAWRESSAKILKDRDKEKNYTSIYINTTKILMSITVVLIVFVPIAYNILIDKSYHNGLIFVPILAFSVFYSSMSAFYGGIFTAFKDTKILGTTSFAAAFINLIINILFINKIGLYAAAFSTLIAFFIIYLYRKSNVKKYIVLKENKKNYMIQYFMFFSSVICFIIQNLFIKCTIGLLIIILILIYDMDIINSVINTIKLKLKKEKKLV